MSFKIEGNFYTKVLIILQKGNRYVNYFYSKYNNVVI